MAGVSLSGPPKSAKRGLSSAQRDHRYHGKRGGESRGDILDWCGNVKVVGGRGGR
jgi:hypothetical protein